MPYATVVLVADGAAAFADRERILGSGQPPLECRVDADRGICYLAEIIEGVYVDVTARGVAGDAGTADRALVNAREALSALISQGVTAPTWVPAADVIPIQSGCDELLPPEQLAEILETPTLTITRPSGGWGVEFWMLSERWTADACIYLPEGGNEWEGPTYGQLTWLPGSEWVYDEAVGGQDLKVASGDDKAAAVLDCSVKDGYDCVVDILAGGWVRYWMSDDVVGDAQRREIAQAVAEVVINNVQQ